MIEQSNKLVGYCCQESTEYQLEGDLEVVFDLTLLIGLFLGCGTHKGNIDYIPVCDEKLFF